MPSRKQRRRQEKLRRHEWEEVWVDAEGRELDPEEAPEGAPGPRARGEQKSTASRAATRGMRVVQPPSWRRVAKRGLIFAPLMFLTVHLLSGDELTTAQKVSQTAFLLLVFLPFSYLMDRMTYRMWRRRTESADRRDRPG